MKIIGDYIHYTEDGYNTIARSFAEIDRLPKEKENALIKFAAIIARSWTFARMTPEEQKNCIAMFEDVRTSKALRGSWSARWDVLNAIYAAFLAGLGYVGGATWREEAKDDE